MAVLSENIKLGKKGINFITTVVDDCMCNFHSIIQENDIGIDGQIELFDENKIPTGKLISLQIKTGKSYYDLNKSECVIPIESHKNYWLNLEMPVIGIVCIMDEKYESVYSAFWVNIKEYLLSYPTATNITFKMCQYNEFNKEKFRKYFYQLINGKLPQIDMDETLRLLNGNTADKLLAINVLQVSFSHEIKAWEILFSIYENNIVDIEYSDFFDSVSYAYFHPDHWIQKGIHEFSQASTEYVRKKVEQFNKKDIINILQTIENHFFDRGTIGQTADIIIQNINNSKSKLLDIVLDTNIDSNIRFDAEIILAHQNKVYYLENIRDIKTMNAECTDLLLEYIEEFGEYDLY